MNRKVNIARLLLAIGITGMALTQSAQALENNVPLSNLSAKAGEVIRHTIEVPEGSGLLSIAIAGGNGDADLYVRYGAKPTTRRFNCRPYRTGNRESCYARQARAGTYHIMLRAYRAFSGVTLKARFVDLSGQPTPTPTPTPPVAGCADEVQQALFEAHNELRAQGQNCGGSYYPAVPSLEWSCPLSDVAAAHSTDMAEVNYFSHTGSDGSSPGDRMTASGYAWRAYGENIAAGQPTVDIVMQGWMDSPGHCKNIMSSAVTEMGAAKISSPGADYSRYWTVLFGRPQ